MSKSLLAKRYESADLRVRILLFFVDIVGKLLFLLWKRYSRPSQTYKPEKVKKILILRLDGLGDVVLSSAALREIREGFPQAEITLVVSTWARDIVKCMPFYNHLIVHDCSLFSFFRGSRTLHLKNELNFIKILKENSYDLGIDLRGDLLSIIPLFLSGSRFRFAKDTRGGKFLLTHIVKWKNGQIKHERDKALRLVETLGLPVRKRETELKVPMKDKEYVERYLTEKGITDSDRLITIAPCAQYYFKSWRPERFAQIASIIINESNHKIVLVGSRRDRDILDGVNVLAEYKAINSGGYLTLSQVAALIARSDMFIGNDSGLIHIAAAVKTPMIQLFGPGDHEAFGYSNDQSVIIKQNTCPYHPCTQTKCKNQADWCLDKISVDDVFTAFKDLVAK